MATEPYASTRRVFWVVDDGSSHRGQRAVGRMHERWPNVHLIQLPVHASWLNQIWDLLLRRATQGPHPQRLLQSH